MDVAIELDQYSGYLGPLEQKRQAEIKARYDALLRAFADGVIRAEGSGDAAIDAVQRDMAEMREASGEHGHGLYYGVGADLEHVIQREAGKRPWLRKARIHISIIVLVCIVIGGVGFRFYSAIPVDEPLTSRTGMVQRAAVIDKALWYDDHMLHQSLRGNWFKPILYWPVEPTEPETKAAGELMGLIFAAVAYAREERLACNLPIRSETIGVADVALLKKVTAYLRDPQVQWAGSAPETVLNAVRTTYPCTTP